MSQNTYDDMGNYYNPVDGIEYKPSPQIIPDTETGFDINGDYHSNGADMDPYRDGGRWANHEERVRIVGRNKFAHFIIRTLIQDAPEGTGGDDELYARLNELDLPYDFTPDEIYKLYESNYNRQRRGW